MTDLRGFKAMWDTPESLAQSFEELPLKKRALEVQSRRAAQVRRLLPRELQSPLIKE